jgi:hypothetical protein
MAFKRGEALFQLRGDFLEIIPTTTMAPIAQTKDYLTHLRQLIENPDSLEKRGFVTRFLTDEELLLKRRCSGCNKSSLNFHSISVYIQSDKSQLCRNCFATKLDPRTLSQD